MSKERELLDRCAETLKCYGWISGLVKEIEELLAQPEQEPVAWRGVNFTEAEGDWVYRDFDEPFTDSNFKNVGEALYLAPPKLEPEDEQYYKHIKEHKEQIEADFKEQQSEEKWYANSLGDGEE